MTDYDSRLPIRAKGIYDSLVNYEPSTSGVTAHLRTYAGVHASLVVATDITYTAVAVGAIGDTISIVYTGTGVAGSETVAVTGTGPWTITVDLAPASSTATQVVAAITSSVPASALVTAAVVAGHGTNVQALFSAAPLAGGIDAILSDDAALLNRVTSITNGTKTSLDVSLQDSTGAAFTNVNPLPVTVTNAIAGTEVFVYQTNANVTKNNTSTATHPVTSGKTMQLQKVYGTSAGKAKFEVLWGTTGSETVRIVGFNSTANPNWEYVFQAPQLLLDTQSVKVRVTNLDGTTDLYSNIEGVES